MFSRLSALRCRIQNTQTIFWKCTANGEITGLDDFSKRRHFAALLKSRYGRNLILIFFFQFLFLLKIFLKIKRNLSIPFQNTKLLAFSAFWLHCQQKVHHERRLEPRLKKFPKQGESSGWSPWLQFVSFTHNNPWDPDCYSLELFFIYFFLTWLAPNF